jgi:hypothetical protein
MEKIMALLAIAAVVVVIALLAFSGYMARDANQKPASDGQTEDIQVASVISEQYASLIGDQLNAQTIDQSTIQMQDGMASDMSEFYT